MGVEDIFKKQLDRENLQPEALDMEVSLDEVKDVQIPDEEESLPDHWREKLLDIIPNQSDRESLLERVISGELTDRDREIIRKIRSEMGFVTQ